MTSTVSLSRRPTAMRRAATIALWVLQAALAFQFAGAGLLKLSGDPAMGGMFAEIGAGQWFRHLVGALELAGAVGLLIPRLAGLAALGLAGIMVGATVTNLVILDVSPALTLALLLACGIVVWFRRAQISTSVSRVRRLRPTSPERRTS